MNVKLQIFEIYPKEILKNNIIKLEIINSNIKSKIKFNINEHIQNNKFINLNVNDSIIYFYLYINNHIFGKEEISIKNGIKWICIKNINNSSTLNRDSKQNKNLYFNKEIKLKILFNYIKKKFTYLNSFQIKNKEIDYLYLSSRNSIKKSSRNKIFNKKIFIKNLSLPNVKDKKNKLYLSNDLKKNNKNKSQKNIANYKIFNLSNNKKLNNKSSKQINNSFQCNSNDLNNNILLNSIITLTNESSDKENKEYIQLNTSNLNIKKIFLKSSNLNFKNNILDIEDNNSNEISNYINDKNDNIFEFNNLIKEFNNNYYLNYNNIEENKISIQNQFKILIKNIIMIFYNYFKEFIYLKKQNEININILNNFSDKIKEIIKLKYKLDIFKEKNNKLNYKNLIKLSYKENYNLKNINYSLNIMKKIMNINENYLNITIFNKLKEKNLNLIEIIKKIYSNSENKKFLNENQKNFIENKIMNNFEKIEVKKTYNKYNFNNFNTNILKSKLNFNKNNEIRKNLINSFEKVKTFEKDFLPIKKNNIILKLKKLKDNKFYQSLNVSLLNYSKYNINKK